MYEQVPYDWVYVPAVSVPDVLLRVQSFVRLFQLQPVGQLYVVPVVVCLQQHGKEVEVIFVQLDKLWQFDVNACADDVSPSASDKPTFRFGKERGNKNAEIWD